MLLVYEGGKFANEYSKLEGKWLVVGLQYQNKQYDAKDVGDSIFSGRIVITKHKPSDIEQRCDIYSMTLNPASVPKQMKCVVAGGEIKGQCQLGIYNVEGNTLTIAFSEFGLNKYPKDFTVKPDVAIMNLRKYASSN
jgi:uncharacterized protein (TIGR03067 family)